jgi:uncharacterized BrkB/YihY/UPF0761 family membrane protein
LLFLFIFLFVLGILLFTGIWLERKSSKIVSKTKQHSECLDNILVLHIYILLLSLYALIK